MRGLVLCLLVGVLAGCATRPNCDPRELADQAVAQAVPAADLGQRYPACPDRMAEIRAAHAQVVAERCRPADAWQAGSAHRAADPVCEALGDRPWREAHRLGWRYGEFEEELADIRDDLAEADGREAGRLRLEERRIIREMEQIEGVARIRGWPLQRVESAIEQAISVDQ